MNPGLTGRVDPAVWGGGSALDAEGLRHAVQRSIDTFIDDQAVVLAEVSADLDPLVAAIRDLLRGGKRLRPAFCYWGFRASGGESSDQALVAASALEFLQACALIHDDVMDGSDTRRGLPAAHRRFGTLHRGAGWLGSSENFGVGAAILLGDLCLSWADELLFKSGMPDDALARAKPVYDLMRTELMGGQYLDLLEQAIGGGSVERAMRVVRYKSAKYTIERPLHIGAALAGAQPHVMSALSGYGLPLGEAFQLRDDVLGVFGDPSETGKPAGDDLREGKRTVLIARALESATEAQAAQIRARLGDPALDPQGVELLRGIIAETGALAAAEAAIESLTAQSLDCLDSFEMPTPARDVLGALAIAATSRSM